MADEFGLPGSSAGVPAGDDEIDNQAAAVRAALEEGEVLEDLLAGFLGSGETPDQLKHPVMGSFRPSYEKWSAAWRARRAKSSSRNLPAHQVDKATAAAETVSAALGRLPMQLELEPGLTTVVSSTTAAVHGSWRPRLEDREPFGPIYNEVRSALATLTAAQAALTLHQQRR